MKLKKALLVPVKVAGTVALSATGTASAILRKSADVAGFDLGSDLFGATQDASFESIKKIWGSSSEPLSEGDYLHKQATEKISAASHCREMAEAARKAGNTEKEEQYLRRYEDLMEQYRALIEESKKANIDD